jgi:hypothetical protein
LWRCKKPTLGSGADFVLIYGHFGIDLEGRNDRTATLRKFHASNIARNKTSHGNKTSAHAGDRGGHSQREQRQQHRENASRRFVAFHNFGVGTRMASASFNIKSGVSGSSPMRGDRPESPDGGCKILQFRRRNDADRNREQPNNNVEHDVDRLLDLGRYEEPDRYEEPSLDSRYEEPGREASNYRALMIENVAAVVLLSVLVAFAAFDVISLEQIQHCASAGSC